MKYFKSNNGKNCPEDQIITMENVCRAAAAAIGFPYQHDVNENRFPAGCSWHFYSTSKVGVYFNKITDPSQTHPENDKRRGGLCMTLSKP